MRVYDIVYAFALVEGNKGKKNKVRTPSVRADRNKRFLSQWFDNNCPTSEDAIRPKRCNNWKERFFTQWDRMNVAFEKECGFFDPDIPNGGPPPQLRKRRDIQRQLVGFEVEERLLMKRDAEQDYEYSYDYGELIATDDSYDNNDGDSQDTPRDYDSVSYNQFFREVPLDYYYDPDELSLAGSADEEGPVREDYDYSQDLRTMSMNPARALRQLTNAMKQYCKRYISQCGFEKNKNGHTNRIRSHYKRLAILHQYTIDLQAAKDIRIRAREEKKANRNRF